jgi:exodeoxyribonuclease VII small subunit
MDATTPTFESALAELEQIVKALEGGDLTLERALTLFERGVELSRFCHGRLDEAEKRIEILTDRGELRQAPASLERPGDEGAR